MFLQMKCHIKCFVIKEMPFLVSQRWVVQNISTCAFLPGILENKFPSWRLFNRNLRCILNSSWPPNCEININSRNSRRHNFRYLTMNFLRYLQVVKMMIVVVTIFVVCWLPTHIYFIVLSHLPHLSQSAYIQELYLGIYWLAMSNTMYNPIIYFWMNSRWVARVR